MNHIYGNTLVLGDSSYLAHHGILGQKWGIRRFQNKDGSRTAEGKKRYKTMQAAHGTRARGNSPFDRAKNRAIDKAKDEFNELLDNARYGKNKAKYDAAVDEWDKAQTHRYDEYEKEFDKYASIAGMANAYRCGWDQPNAGFGSRDNMLEFATEFYKYDDGDQGKFNSYDYFLVGKGENPNDVQDKAFKASSAMWELAKEDAKDLFGDLADKKDGPGSTVATSFASSMFNYATAASPITMVDESSGLRYTDQEIKQMQEDIRKFSVEAKRLGTYEEPKHAEKEQRAYDDASKRVFDAVDKADQALQDRFKETDLGKKNPKAIPHIDGYTTGDISSLFSKSTEKQIYDWIKKQDDLREPIREAEEIRSKAESKLRKKVEHASMGGNMNYIYGNTLILGDTSYLEHHGIKNQKWGVRRFQNPDGSLTAAGRIRYGVTGAAKAAFKVGKKLGSATASAAKAGVKKAKENAYAKKKEKVSQTREGVLKNKKMFTADELKALENRFKIEDEMSEASLRHGQAVAKTVSQYANTTRDVLSALQTGGNAVSSITKAFADIQSYQNAKGVAEAAKEKGMTTKEFDLFLKEKYPNAKKDDGSKKKGKNSNKAEHSDSEDDDDDDNPPNNGGGGSKKQAEYAANRQAVQEALYNKKTSGLKQREDYLNKRQDALVKVSKQRQSEQDARDEDLNRRDKAASEREEKLKSIAKDAADVMNKLKERQDNLDRREADLNNIANALDSEIGYRIDTISDLRKTLHDDDDSSKKKKSAKHSAIGEEMYAGYLEHFGTKGMKWGVRRYQNPDGTLTDAGRKHYQKKLDLEERKLTAANAARGQYERVRPAATAGSAIVGAIVGASLGAASMLTPAGIAAGAAYMAAVSGASMYTRMTIKGAVAGAGAKRSKKKISKYKEALSQDGFQIQNGVLMYGFAPSDELEHFGLKGMKWGVRRFQNKDGSLTEAGKQRYANTGNLNSGGGGGGGAPEEEDEETKKAIEEAAKKAGMTVDEYRKKFADKVAALKEKARDAAWDARYAAEDAADAVTGKTSKQIAEKSAKSAEENEKKAAAARKEGRDDDAAKYEEWAKQSREISEYRQNKYDNSLAQRTKRVLKKASDTVYNEAGGKYKKAAAENNAAANRALREAAEKDMKAKESNYDYERLKARGAKMAASWAKSSAESYKKSADDSRYAHRMYKKNQAEANKRYQESLAGRAEAASKKIGEKAQEAKDKLKSKAPKRSIALEVASTGPAPITPTQIHTADMYNKYFGAVARARKTAANSTAAQRAKYGDRRNIRERAEAEELNNLRAKEKRDEAIRLRMAKKFDKKAESARAHGNTAKAEAFEKESNRQFNKAPWSGSKAEAFEAARDAKLASHLVRNAATAKQAQSATLAENRNRNAAHLAERRRERSINEAKAKIRSGKLPTSELTRYAKSTVGQLKSEAKAELARREREQALTSMGSDYARATARVTTTSSTTNTADAHNEKLARDRRDKRKQAARASATAKKNRLAGSGRKKYVSGQTGSIGRVGSGRGKTSTRR